MRLPRFLKITPAGVQTCGDPTGDIGTQGVPDNQGAGRVAVGNGGQHTVEKFPVRFADADGFGDENTLEIGRKTAAGEAAFLYPPDAVCDDVQGKPCTVKCLAQFFGAGQKLAVEGKAVEIPLVKRHAVQRDGKKGKKPHKAGGGDFAFFDLTPVVPLPKKGSRTMPPSGQPASRQGSTSLGG